jgi:N-formylglutamate amidohydrolase
MQLRDSDLQTPDELPAAPWSITAGDGPVLATAIHAGHDVRPDVAEFMAIPEADRRREEDPLTDIWTSIGDSSIRVFRSRFEVDLNRPRQKAVALRAEDTWGLKIWAQTPPERVMAKSLAEYDAFYREVAAFVERLTGRWDQVLVLDLHSYNHRRSGPDRSPASERDNPDINIGTGTLKGGHWRAHIDTFISALGSCTVKGRPLDVRENVKFQGGHFPDWLHTRFAGRLCTLSIECKKFFMDELSSTAYIACFEDLRVAIVRSIEDTRPLLATTH